MTTSQDKDHFFQSTHALNESSRKAQKSKNKDGYPIHLPSKILSVIRDPQRPDTVYVAESAGIVRRVNLDTQDSSHVFKGPNGPVTCLAISSKHDTIYAGSWDKTVWCWNIESCQATQRLQGHTDFVKALVHLSVNNRNLLISGGADARIIVWDANTAERLHTLKGNSRGILSLALDPASFDISNELKDITFFSASSDPFIRRWRLDRHLDEAGEVKPKAPIQQHETSVNALCFDSDGDLWTASSDGTTKCLSRENEWQVDTVMSHGDFVRDIVMDDIGRFVATVGRDEEVKIWDRSSGRLVHTYSGHFEEITKSVMISGNRLVTVSIDRTIRLWPLNVDEVSRAQAAAVSGIEDKVAETKETGAQGNLLTEAEERELAELMADD